MSGLLDDDDLPSAPTPAKKNATAHAPGSLLDDNDPGTPLNANEPIGLLSDEAHERIAEAKEKAKAAAKQGAKQAAEGAKKIAAKAQAEWVPALKARVQAQSAKGISKQVKVGAGAVALLTICISGGLWWNAHRTPSAPEAPAAAVSNATSPPGAASKATSTVTIAPTTAPAVAADGTCQLTGLVTDASGAPVAGATVTLIDNMDDAKTMAATDAHGAFSVVATPVIAHSFGITVSAPGYLQGDAFVKPCDQGQVVTLVPAPGAAPPSASPSASVPKVVPATVAAAVAPPPAPAVVTAPPVAAVVTPAPVAQPVVATAAVPAVAAPAPAHLKAASFNPTSPDYKAPTAKHPAEESAWEKEQDAKIEAFKKQQQQPSGQ